MPDTAVVIVCLPKVTPTDQLAALAVTRLAAVTPWTSGILAGYFPVSTRLRRARLVAPWRNTAVGGPIQLLELDLMRTRAFDASWHRWHVWQRVVDGTRPAQPYWHFLDRHRDDPTHYPLAKTQRQYLAQPRIAAMRTYNALPNKVLTVSTDALEAFQTGPHAYAHLGLLAAVPADGIVTLDGRYLATTSDRLADRLSHLEGAQAELTALHARDQLVALTTS